MTMKYLFAIIFIFACVGLAHAQPARTAAAYQSGSFSDLTTTAPNGSVRYCINCAQTNPCTSGVGAAVATKVSGVWNCAGTNATAGVNTITGTANQVIVNVPSGNITLSLPQSIATTSTPRFSGIGIGAASAATGINLIGPIKPNANSATAIQFTAADGTTVVMDVDTSNSRVGIGTVSPDRTLEVLASGGNQLRLTHTDSAAYADFDVGAGGTLTLAPIGNLNFNATGNQLDPTTNYDQNLGQLSKKYLSLHAAELWVETLVAQNTLATIGGRILVAPTDILIADLSIAGTSIDVKYNNLANGDRVYMESNSKVEFMAVTSGATVITGGFRYTVSRNLDGSGANDWFAGDAMVNTGQTGNGFIDLYSVRGVASASEVGPTIAFNVRNSATYNDWSEVSAIGNLNGLYGYSADTYGVGLGKYAASNSHITLDSTNGLRIFSDVSTVRVGITTAGVMTFRDSTGAAVLTFDASAGAEITKKLTMPGASSAIAIGTTPPTSASAGTGLWLDRTGLYGLLSGTPQASLSATTGAITAGAGNVVLNVNGITITQGSGSTNAITWKNSGTTIGTLHTLYTAGSPNESTVVLQSFANAIGTDTAITLVKANQPSSATSLIFALRQIGVSSSPASASYANLGQSGSGSFKGLVVGSLSDPVASAVLQLDGTTGALVLPRLTTTQRDALTPTDGMLFYNSTTNKAQIRAAGAWVDLH